MGMTVFVAEQRDMWLVKVFNSRTQRASTIDKFKYKIDADQKAKLMKYVLKKIHQTCVKLGGN